MSALEFVKTCLDDILIISKDKLDDHLNKLRMVFTKLWDVWLNIFANKSEFCAKETEYLCHTLTKKI